MGPLGKFLFMTRYALRTVTRLAIRYKTLLLAGLVAFFLAVLAAAYVLLMESPGNAGVIAGLNRLLHGGTLPLAMAGQDHAVDPLPSSFQSDDRLGPTIRSVRETLPGAGIAPTGFKRDDYLDLVSGVVKHFRQFQNKKGRIIDPYLHREVQYSTPTYALAAATLVVSKKDPELLGSASNALESSLFQLASSRVNDQHGDFFITPTMMAYRLLKNVVDPATKKRWDEYLRMIDPQLAFADLIGPGQDNVINWNSSAISGEFLRHKEGFTDEAFVNRYLDAQIIRFIPEGLYRDPGAPLAYDGSARFNFLLLLNEGYRGKHQKDLEILLERGAWLSLLMQSPGGDAPTGGRSSEHVWNDALQCASFELWARRMQAAGDQTGARAFKRGAHLAAGVMSRWIRPSGEFWIVKNRFDPAVRHGFESYSSHSQYNLLAAAYLAIAWSVADERIVEGASPADVGGFVVDIPVFHKIFANSGGNYVEIETAADPHYNSTGLLRTEQGTDSHLGLGDNVPISEAPFTLGFGWRIGDETHALAEFSGEQVHASITGIEASPKAVRFSVVYQMENTGIKGVTESYTLTPDALSVSAMLDGPVDSWRVTLPAFLSDGRNAGEVSFNENAATIRSGHFKQTFEVTAPPGSLLKKTGQIVSTRTGDYAVVESEGKGNAVSYRLSAPVIDGSAGAAN